MLQRSAYSITAGELGYEQLQTAISTPARFSLSSEAIEAIEKSSQLIDKILRHNEPVYGVTTGFGLNARSRIPRSQAEELQRRLILSHCAGVGELMPSDVVRLMLLLKINALSQGYSCVRLPLVEMLIKFLNEDVCPCIPAKGSVGASGDLAPLAHIGAALMGIGDVRWRGQKAPALEVLSALDLRPYVWGPKEGLALINGTQASTALAAKAILLADQLFSSALVIGALTSEAVFANASAFDARLHKIRRQRGQIDVAAAFRKLLHGGARRCAAQRSKHDQDPYSIRCQPQVMGACLDQLRNAAQTILNEVNAVSDNPIIFKQGDTFEVVNGGNFHAEGIAFAADSIALAVAEIGSMSERRIALLMDPRFSGLPAFLGMTEGLDSGLMIAHVTAAALTSENKCLAHPSSVDSIPTSANQEDHVSMATHGARRLMTMIDNTFSILAIELLAACQGIDLCAQPELAPITRQAYERVRRCVSFMEQDRYLAADIESAKRLLTGDGVADFVGTLVW
jgi:histidine ammonia-lyase